MAVPGKRHKHVTEAQENHGSENCTHKCFNPENQNCSNPMSTLTLFYFDSNIKNTPSRMPPTAVVLLDNRASLNSRPPAKSEITI